MEVRYYRTCRLTPDVAEIYIYYCDILGITYEVHPDEDMVLIGLHDTRENLVELYKRVIKKLLGGSQRG